MTERYNQGVVNEPNPLRNETSGMFKSIQVLTDKIESLKIAMGNACNSAHNMDTQELEELSAEFDRLWSLRDVVKEQLSRGDYGEMGGNTSYGDYVERRPILPIDLSQTDIWRPQGFKD